MAQKFTVPVTIKNLSSAGSDGITVFLDQESFARLKVEAGGRITWGDGSGAGDTNLYRDEASVLKTDDTFKSAGLFVAGTQIDPTGATTGDALVFNGTKFVSASVAAGGGATLTVSDTPPTVDITEGDLWFESDTGKTFVYYDSFWVEVGGGGSIESGVATQSDWNQTNISAADYIENKPDIYNTGDDLYLDPQGTGLVYLAGDMIPLSSSVSLGSSASPYNEVWVGPSSLKILSQDGGPTITLSNQEDFLRVQSGGLIVESTASVSTGGIFRVDPQGQIFVTSSYQNPNKSSVLTIIGNNVGTFSPPVNNGGMVHITGHDNLTSRIVNDSYGNSVFSQMAGRHAAGTSASPTAARTGPLFRITGAGWRPGADFGIAGDDPPVFVDFYAKEDFEANDTPTEIRFYTTPSGQYEGVLSTVIDSSGIQLEQSGSGITFYDNTVQTTAATGIPAGGLNTQILSKSADTDYAVQWVNEAPAASFTSQVKHLVKNDDSVTLTKGMVVYTSGANGTNILVKRAIANGETTSAQVLGFVEADIAVNATGYVVNNGLVTNINTNSAAAAGDPMWLSASVAGGVIYGNSNKPDAPNHLVYLGVVTRKNANVGQVFVHISNGWELDELHNVSASAPASGDFLKYDGTKWVNDPINLGTDTVGNYMSGVSASTGISISHTPGEGSTATISAVAPMALTQSANNASYPLTISSANEQGGGTGYSDILKLTNSKSGATNINKHFRLGSTGNLEIVNSAYTASLFALTDAGALTVPGPITQTSYNIGDVIKTTIWSAGDMGFTTNYSNGTATYAAIASKTYTPASASSYILVEVYARYYVNGAAEDSFFSQLTWAGNEFAAQRQVWTNGAGGGTRSSTLFPLAGRITNSSPTGYTLAINARRDSADDTLTVYADNAFIVKITEVAR